jgi:Myb-like DNA-binding protein FlbD
MIERMVNEMGKRWAEIARRLGNRSDNASEGLRFW